MGVDMFYIQVSGPTYSQPNRKWWQLGTKRLQTKYVKRKPNLNGVELATTVHARTPNTSEMHGTTWRRWEEAKRVLVSAPSEERGHHMDILVTHLQSYSTHSAGVNVQHIPTSLLVTLKLAKGAN